MRKLTGLIAIVLLSITSLVNAAELKEGTNYITYDPPRPTEAPKGKIEVVEFFWYGCPHCFHLEPAMQAWLKKLPRDVVFRRVPAVFPDRSGNPGQWAVGAGAFYALEAMGISDRMHGKLFDAIHNDRIFSPVDIKGMTDWLGKGGVDAQAFSNAYQSFTVRSKVQRAMQLSSEAYNLDGVPAIIVNGRYRALLNDEPGEGYLAIVDKLIVMARNNKK
jgi:thiol:disulfide interchange protein DsbA